MKRFKTWLRFATHGPAMVNRIWRRLDESQERYETEAKYLRKQIEQLRSELAQMKVERYEPPRTPEPTKPAIKCQTMKQFHDILDRERELQGDPL